MGLVFVAFVLGLTVGYSLFSLGQIALELIEILREEPR